jgi:hypothetical protein
VVTEQKLSEDLSCWDEAIADAERELATVEKKVKQLKSAIASFKMNKKVGRLWPGSKSIQEVWHEKGQISGTG